MSPGFNTFIRHKGCRSPGELRFQGPWGKTQNQAEPQKAPKEARRRQGGGSIRILNPGRLSGPGCPGPSGKDVGT